jgi:hypothetical protein
MASREQAVEIKDRHSDHLLSIPGVVGVGVAEGEVGQYVLTIHTETDDQEVLDHIPESIEGCPVKVVQSGRYSRF